jgi:hypothetical protein
MDFHHATHRLRIHAGFELDPRQVGLLQSLRPYRPTHETQIADVIACLIAIHPTISAAPQVDRDLVAALWHLCETSRTLASHPHSPLRQNRLAPQPDLDRLTHWLEAIERFCVRMFASHDLPHCLSRTIELLAQHRFQSATHFTFLTPLLEQLQTHPDPQDPDATNLAEYATQAANLLQPRP